MSDGGGVSTTSQILVLTTGGTIDKQYFDALSEFQIVDTVVTQLLERARAQHPFRVEEVFQKDSLDISNEDRAALAGRVAEAPETRIVVTHGTDTMTTTAGALQAIEGKTIVLVGALSPARFADSDAAFNLGMAFAAAQLAPAGVYIAMSGTIFSAGEVVKDRARGAFVRIEAAPANQ